VHGQVALEQGEQHSIPNGPERVEVQIAAGIVAGMLEAGVAALVALRLDVLGLQLLLLLGETAAGRGCTSHHRVAQAGIEAASASAAGGDSSSCPGSLVLATHTRWGTPALFGFQCPDGFGFCCRYSDFYRSARQRQRIMLTINFCLSSRTIYIDFVLILNTDFLFTQVLLMMMMMMMLLLIVLAISHSSGWRRG